MWRSSVYVGLDGVDTPFVLSRVSFSVNYKDSPVYILTISFLQLTVSCVLSPLPSGQKDKVGPGTVSKV